MAIEDLIQDATRRMHKSVEAAQGEFATLRTGRASPALLDRVQIDYYGQQTPLKQLATISAPEPRMLTIQPFDPNSVSTIERAIQESDLGLTPSNDGKLIRLPIPQLTEERRKELVKLAHKGFRYRRASHKAAKFWGQLPSRGIFFKSFQNSRPDGRHGRGDCDLL